MAYGYIDGSKTPDGQVIVIGPYDTEVEATEAAAGRYVLLIPESETIGDDE